MLVLTVKSIPIENYFFLLFLWFKHTDCLHVRFQITALRVSIDERNFTLNLLWLAFEDHLAKNDGLLALILLREVLNDHLVVLKHYLTQVDYVACRKIWNLSCVGAV